jgi:uncharacterized repeat protein (TIGR04138 family)
MPDESDPPGPEILDDEPCPRCGYNLRGLCEGGRCPECGRSIPLNFEFDELDEAEAAARRLVELQPIADAVRRPVEAVAFVRDALAFVSARAKLAGRKQGFSAQEFAWGLRDYSIDEFFDADAARTQLAEWGLDRSEDVGEIFAALIDAKLAAPSREGELGEFKGLFTIATLFQ